MHPLLTLLATRPQLVVDHAQAYAALFSEEFGQARATWRRQVLLYAAALCALGVAAVLAGVATLLWFATAAPAQAVWVFLTVPSVPLLLAVVCLLLARQPAQAEAFAHLGRQLNDDMAMLRAAGEP